MWPHASSHQELGDKVLALDCGCTSQQLLVHSSVLPAVLRSHHLACMLTTHMLQLGGLPHGWFKFVQFVTTRLNWTRTHQMTSQPEPTTPGRR